MRDAWIVGLAMLYVGIAIGVCWRELANPFPRTRAARAARREEAFARDVEGRLTGRTVPKHRAQTEPVRISAARIQGTKNWSR